MLWLMCRDFQVDFDDSLWETVSDMKKSRLTCSSRARLTCSILLDLPLSVICIYIKCPNSFKTSLHNNFYNNLFHMKNPISCSSLYLHVNHAHYNLHCWTAMKSNVQEMAWASQQLLSHNSCWEKQTSHRMLFLCLLGLFTPWYECVCDRFDCKQCCDSHAGIFKWILMIIFEKLRYEQILINMWLPCTVNV